MCNGLLLPKVQILRVLEASIYKLFELRVDFRYKFRKGEFLWEWHLCKVIKKNLITMQYRISVEIVMDATCYVMDVTDHV